LSRVPHGGAGLPGSAFGDRAGDLRLRVATSLLYGDTEDERTRTLDARTPTSLPWVQRGLDRLEQALAALTSDG
jgi:aspartate aminotransferase